MLSWGMPPTHSRGCQLRWVTATWTLTLAILMLYIALLGRLSSLTTWDLAAALVCLGTSLVAVWVLARLTYLVLAFVVTAVAGFTVAYVWMLLNGNTGAEDGTVWLSVAAAIAGATSAIAAWVVLRLAHRTMSRDTCPTSASAQQSPGP